MSKRNGYRQKEREAMRRSVDRIIAQREMTGVRTAPKLFTPPTDEELDEILFLKAREGTLEELFEEDDPV